MKKLYALILLVIMFSCKTVKTIKSAGYYAIVSGQIIADTPIKDIRIKNLTHNREKVKIANGSFIDTIFLKKPNLYTLEIGTDKIDLYLEKGANINVLYNLIDPDNKITIAGEKSATSKAIADYRKELTEKFNENGKYNVFDELKKDEKDFLASLNKSLELRKRLLKKYKTLPEIYKKVQLFESEIVGLYNQTILYKDKHPKLTENPDFKVSDSFPNIYLPPNEEEMFRQSEMYQYALLYDLEVQARDQIAAAGSGSLGLKKLEVVNNKIKSDVIKNKMLYIFASGAINSKKEVEYRDAIAEFFFKHCTSESYKSKLKSKMEKNETSSKTLAKGTVSPKFVDYENHAGGVTSLDDFKGKYVYIDVWATWCGPCIQEIPALKELEKEYHGKNIEFISISVDKRPAYKKWRKMITDKNLTGTQLIADKAFESDFIKAYFISGIPRFILIDPQGNIVNYNAPRPSSSEIKEVFNNLNI